MLASLSAASRAALTGRSYFPQLISAPFRAGLHEAFAFAILACLVAAGASLLRGGKFQHAEPPGEHQVAQDGRLARVTTREEQHAR